MKKTNNYLKPFLYSITVHLVLILLLALSFYQSRQRFVQNNTPQPQIIQATAVSQQQLQQELDQRAAAERARLEAIRKAAEEKARKKAEAKARAKKEAERKKAIELAKKKKAEAKARARKEAERKKAEEAKRQAERKKAEEAKRQAERKKAEEAKRQAERKKAEEAKRQAEQKKQRESQEQALQQQLEEEENQREAARQRQLRGIIDKYRAKIQQAIERQWIVPPTVDKNTKAELRIQLAPGGEVINVTMAKSSGNNALDQSAIDAVYKASPLPVPQEANLFEPFRTLYLTVDPQNVI